MKILLVFDASIKVELSYNFNKESVIEGIDLFPLTGNPAIIDKVKNTLSSNACPVESLNTADMVEKQIDYLKGRICRWSADIGEYRIREKKIKEWFLLKGENVSTWWFSLLSEKNTGKTDAFLKMAQVHAIDDILRSKCYPLCAIAISDKELRKSVLNVAHKFGSKIRILPTIPPKALKLKMQAMLKQMGIAGELLLGIYIWLRFLNRRHLALKRLGVNCKRLPSPDSLLLVSYFPAVEKKPAQRGIFINKYASALQDKLKELKIPIVWVLMYVPIDGYKYSDAVNLTLGFAENGEKAFIAEEFLSTKDAIRGLLLWLKQMVISFFLLGVAKERLLSGVIGPECEPIIKSLWRVSFCGVINLEAILYYFIFKSGFDQIPGIKDCLYWCEMHAWEKALNAAKNQKHSYIRTIGFQHAHISKNHFAYFYDPLELRGGRGAVDMPMPDLVACNGEYMCSILSKSGYPCLARVEALRYLYMNKILLSAQRAKGENILLVAGSIMKDESATLLSFVHSAFPKAREFGIWFKGHPLLPFEQLFEELGIDLSETGYQIRHDLISDLLGEARTVIVGSSGIAMEALIFGCEVIVPVFPDSINMNPLVDFEKYYHRVTCIEDLQLVMEEISKGVRRNDIDETRGLIKHYWEMDDALHNWERLLLSNKKD